MVTATTTLPSPLCPLQQPGTQYAGRWVGPKRVAKNLAPPVLYPQTVQPLTSCYSKLGIMALLDVFTGAVFIVDASSVGGIFLQLHIPHRSISLTQHCTVRNCVLFCTDSCWRVCCLVFVWRPYFGIKPRSQLQHFGTQQDTCVTDLPSIEQFSSCVPTDGISQEGICSSK